MQALKKIRLDEDGLAMVDREPEPAVSHGEVKIRVIAASICGTDQAIYQSSVRPGIRQEMLNHNGGELSRYRPIVIGHEFCGEVVEAGEGVSEALVRVGDYVTSEMHICCGHCQQCLTGQQHICQYTRVKGVHLDGAFAEYVTVPSANVINLEVVGGRRAIPPSLGAFLDALGNAVHTVMEGRVTGKTVAILGCGAQGLMATAVARTMGASRIYITDFSNPRKGIEGDRLRERFALAHEVGADFSYDTNTEASPGQREEFLQRARDESGGGVDVVLEMSGSEAAYRDAGEIVKNGGRIELLGIPARPLSSYDIGKYIVWKGVTVQGIFGRRMYETWFAMLDLLASDKSGLKQKLLRLVSPEVVTLSGFERGFELVRSHQAVKQLLVPDNAAEKGELLA
ncbi:MAG TPA: alcohol dehydrogenase catalytic domain-containing protein [Blastocatellia bacterium]|nr:alcohol dehydrogenase catalytic domain-containing protein [Blastocatellia bacterium]